MTKMLIAPLVLAERAEVRRGQKQQTLHQPSKKAVQILL
jgi:hypothetical protein